MRNKRKSVLGRNTLTAAGNGARSWAIALLDDRVTWSARHGASVVHESTDRVETLNALTAAYTGQIGLAASAGFTETGPEFVATFVEGEQTRDGGGYSRIINVGATRLDRPFPLPLMATTETTWGHDGAELVGVIEAGTTMTGSVTLTGRFDTSERAIEIARMVTDGILTRHSPDLGDETVDFVCTEYEDDEWGEWCVAGTLHFLEATLLGTTILPFPALDSAMISIPSSATETETDPVVSLVAAANLVPARSPARLLASGITERDSYPADWFNNPNLTGPTAPVVTPDGRYYGHLATFDSCHIGQPEGPDVCTTAPKSESGYAFFHTGGTVSLDSGEKVRVGNITVGTGHASRYGVTPDEVTAHYDDTGTVAAVVRAGEDEWGIWVAGAVRPGLDDWSLWALQMSALSGDWRAENGNLELRAALAVNVPGFPIPDVAAMVAGGECSTLIAAGARTMGLVASAQTPVVAPTPDGPTPWATGEGTEDRLARLEKVVAELGRVTAPLEGLAIERLAARLVR